MQAASTWALVGLIWTIQVVHYPLFAEVGEDRFSRYSQLHSRLITWIVAPLMFCELVSSYLLWTHHSGIWETVGLWMVALLWGSTGLFFAPLHGRLARGFEERSHRLLVQGNWFRTALWTARGALVFLLA